MTATARQLCATPSFAGSAVCATPRCDTILSRYNEDPDGLCAQCRRRTSEEPERSSCSLDLERLVAGLLLVHDAMHSGESLNIAQGLAALGIEVDCWTVRSVMRHIGSRHGIIARGVRGRPGYALIEWQRRYQPVVGFGGIVMDRDPDSGRYAGPVAIGVAAAPEAAKGSDSQPSLPGLAEDDTEG